MLNIDSLTIKELKQIQSLLKGVEEKDSDHPYEIGQNYLIRTVTHYYTGKLEKVTQHELVLSSAAWVADTGRFHDCLKKGTLNEVEPFVGSVIVGRGAIVDACIWKHELPKEQK